MGAAEKFAEYTFTPESAWSLVEGKVLDHAFKRYNKDRFNRLRRSENRSIDAITTRFGSLIPSNFSALDLGAGVGRVASALIDYGVQPENILAVDNNPEMLADSHFPKGVKQLVADISKLSPDLRGEFPRNWNFDFVAASMVLHLLSFRDYVLTLKMVRKRVTENSLLYIMVPHPLRENMVTIPGYHRRGRIMEKAPWGDELHYPTKAISDYERGLMEAGFHCFSIRTAGVGLKIEDNLLLSDEAVWSRIQKVRNGAKVTPLPHYFRLWMMAEPANFQF